MDKEPKHDPVRSFLRLMIARRGTNKKALSKAIGQGPTYITDYLDGSPVELPEKPRKSIAKTLRIPEFLLRPLTHPENAMALVERLDRDGAPKADMHPDFSPAGLSPDQIPELQGEMVQIAEIDVAASSGPGRTVHIEAEGGRWGFPEPWLRAELKAAPVDLRIITIEGDSMISDPPRQDDLQPGDKVVVNINDRRATPPGKFIVHDGLGLVAKVVSHIPDTEPARIRIASRNASYPAYERVVDEAYIIGRIVGRWQRM